MIRKINLIIYLLVYAFLLTGVFWRGIQINNYFSVKDDSQELISNITPSGTIGKELSDRAIKGDGNAYSEILSLELGNSQEFGPHALGYSIIMANKYKSSNACHNIYSEFCMLYNSHEDSLNISLDPQTKELLIYFLNKGKMLGDNNCATILKHFN